jgi:hypothetical protein
VLFKREGVAAFQKELDRRGGPTNGREEERKARLTFADYVKQVTH